LFIRYRLENQGAVPLSASLYAAIRPFQVSPPWQGYRDIGGVSRIHRITLEQGDVRVDGRLALVPLSTPASFGAMTFDEGSISEAIAAETRLEVDTVEDGFGFASAALRFDLSVEPGGRGEVWIATPLGEHEEAHPSELTGVTGGIEARLKAAIDQWSRRLGTVELHLPEAARDSLEGCQGALATSSPIATVPPYSPDRVAIRAPGFGMALSWQRRCCGSVSHAKRTSSSTGMRGFRPRTAMCPVASIVRVSTGWPSTTAMVSSSLL
jgi:hypothetical protein